MDESMPEAPRSAVEDDLRALVSAYVAATAPWVAAAPDDAERARRRVLALSHGERVLRRLRAEVHRAGAMFRPGDTATAPEIDLAEPAGRLWDGAASRIAALLRAHPDDDGIGGRVRQILQALEQELQAARGARH